MHGDNREPIVCLLRAAYKSEWFILDEFYSNDKYYRVYVRKALLTAEPHICTIQKWNNKFPMKN